jgi:hypothetical protein
MRNKTFCHFALLGLLFPLLRAVPAQAQGDQILAQVADGTGADGTQFITKLRIINLGPDPSTPIAKLKVVFFHQDGTPWTIATNWGTASEFPMAPSLGSYQTYALNTTGAGSLTSGYAIVRNTDGPDIYSEDYEVSVTAFYEVRKGGSLIDTISVPVSQPTASFVIPVEIDASSNLLTGFALVNLSNSSNAVTMQLFRAQPPPSGSAADGGTSTITLNPNEQKATFLYPSIFSGASSFAGMLVGRSNQPVAILALLQAGTPTGAVLYTTMAAANIDALRRNSYMYLRLSNSLDADHLVSDYFFDQDLVQNSNYYELDAVLPWSLLYQKQSSTTRRLTPQFPIANGSRNSGAQLAVIGPISDPQAFDNLTIQNLQALTYSSNPIDMSDNSPNLAPTFAFAIKTALGHYAKAYVYAVINRTLSTGGVDKDLALEVFVFK